MINRTWTTIHFNNFMILLFISGRRSLWAELSEVKDSGILRLNNIKNKNDFKKKGNKILNGIWLAKKCSNFTSDQKISKINVMMLKIPNSLF